MCARQKNYILSSKQFVTTSGATEVEKTSIASAGIVLVFIFAGPHRSDMLVQSNQFLSTLKQDRHRPSRNSKRQSSNSQLAGILDTVDG